MTDLPVNASLALTGLDAPPETTIPASRDSQVTPFSKTIGQDDIASTREYLLSLNIKGFDIAKFDEAARADGLDPTPQGVDAFGAAIRAAADDYKPSWPSAVVSSLAPEQMAAVASETGAFAASMKFDRGLGAGVIEHLAELGPKLAAMSLDDKVEWKAQQERQLARRHGEAGAAAMRARVASYLASNPTAFGKELSKATVLSSAWLLRTLHAQIMALGK